MKWFRKRAGTDPLVRPEAMIKLMPPITGENAEALRQAMGSIPQGTPLPPEAERHTYGGGCTQTGTIDIEVNPDGRVVAVWFQCLTLPFTVSTVNAEEQHQPPIAIESITYGDLTT
jgi:hypothetical protein